MTSNEYATTIVLPTVREFLAERGDLRRAILACIAVYHTVDYLAQAQVPQGLSKKQAKETRERNAQSIRNALSEICAPSLAVVQGMCNGTKHADPIAARDVPAFALDIAGAGLDQSRVGTPGLEIEHEGARLFIDWCVQAMMLTLRALHGINLDPLNMTFFDAAFRGQPGWQEPSGGPLA